MTDVEPVIAPETTGEEVPEAEGKAEAPDQTVEAEAEPVIDAPAETPDTNGTVKRKAEDEASDEKPDVKKMNTGEMNNGGEMAMEAPIEQPQQPEQQQQQPQELEQPLDLSGGGSLPADTTNAQGEVVGYISCPDSLVSKLIGKKGAVIQHLEAETGNKIQVEHEKPGDPKQVRIIAKSAESLEQTKELIRQTLESDQPPGEVTKLVSCPQNMVGRIIGRSGETIRSLQQASQAKIIVDQDPARFPDGVDREIKMIGRGQCVERAEKMVTELMNAEAGVSAQSVIQKYGLGTTRTMDCPKQMVGRVIGKGGETIKQLQRNTGANIQIDQSVNPCKITATGSTQCVQNAVRVIQDIISEDTFGGGAGGAGGPGGYGGGGGRGGGGMPAYGAYGGYPGQQPVAGFAQPYGAQAGYGGYPNPYAYGYQQPQQQYGGYQQPQQQYGGEAAAYGAQAAYGGGYGGQPGAGGMPAAAPAAAAPAASDWSEEFDPNTQRSYFYNRSTGATQWERPAEMA